MHISFFFFPFLFLFLFIYFSFIPFPPPSPSYPQYIIFAFHHHGVAGHSSASAMIRLRFSPGQKLYKFPGVMCFRWRRAEEQRLMCRKTLLTLTLCKSTSRSTLGGSLLPERRGRLSINKWSAMYRGGRWHDHCRVRAGSFSAIVTSRWIRCLSWETLLGRRFWEVGGSCWILPESLISMLTCSNWLGCLGIISRTTRMMVV